MELTTQQVYNICQDAFNTLKKLKQLPCTWSESYWNSGRIIIDIDDNKLFKHKFWLDLGEGPYIVGKFKIIIKPDYWTNMSTQMVDMTAKIPSNTDDATRIKLRIMYAIYCEYLNNILFCFSNVDQHPQTKNTLVNAYNWYKNL